MRAIASRTLILVLLALGMVRLVSLGLYPLGDTTEARYGEVARQMVAGGDWITPHNDPGVPFWAKPPLSFWAEAASMKLLGVGEFAARLPSLLFAFAVAGLTWLLARRGESGRPNYEAWAALAILASMPLFFVAAGAVMTDMALEAFTAASMVAFWFAWTRPDTADGRWWGYAFFGAMGFALLAKGPVGVALTGISIGLFWLISPERHANLRRIRERLPWIGGTLLMLAIAAPWYLAEESRSPGFLNYFLLGEHVLRFVQPGWKGDMFGNAHAEPRGAIWWFYLWAIGPWVLPVAWSIFRRARGDASARPWLPLDRYLLAWALATPAFFTLARNSIWTYLLPALPALALLLARRCRPDGVPLRLAVPAIAAALATAYFFAFCVVLPLEPIAERRSTKALLETAASVALTQDARILVLGDLRHSMKFYSRGTARRVTLEELSAALREPGEVFVIAEAKSLPPGLIVEAPPVGIFHDLALLHRWPDILPPIEPRASATGDQAASIRTSRVPATRS